MANINVTYQELKDAATKLDAGKEEMNGKLNELKSFINGLVQSGFVTDSASVKFNETYEQYTKGAIDTITALEGLRDYLNTAAQTLQDTDQQLAKALG